MPTVIFYVSDEMAHEAYEEAKRLGYLKKDGKTINVAKLYSKYVADGLIASKAIVKTEYMKKSAEEVSKRFSEIDELQKKNEGLP